MEQQLAQVVSALKRLRTPFAIGEYDLHALAEDALREAGIPFMHEVCLAPRCRIDFLADMVGIEIKKGKPDRKMLLHQLERYASSTKVEALVVLVERTADLPAIVMGKPCVLLSLNRMWGIAL
jgi:hypothetical protein